MNWKYESGKLQIDGSEVPLTYAKTLDELKLVLKDPNSEGPDPAYWVFRDVKDSAAPHGERSDITVLAAGKIGQEYVKTHGHYHLGDGLEQYKLLRGSAMVLMQKPTFNFESVEAVRLVRMPAGQLVDIPSGWGHTVINIGDEELILENFEPPTINQLYSAYQKLHGASYYVLERDGNPSIEPNTRYRNLPKLQTY
jgi:glucose-6-phosphate isomerase, archaeal